MWHYTRIYTGWWLGVALLLGFGGLRVSAHALQPNPFVAGQEPSPSQPLLVRIAYSPDLRHHPGWSRELECAVSRVNAILEPVTRRPVEIVDKVAWLGGSTDATAYELRQRLVAAVEPGEADIVIGLATGGGSSSFGGVWGGGQVLVEEGLAHYTRGYVVIEVTGGDICDGHRLLAHELAHVFGGVHRTGDELLMTTEGSGVEIDPLNEALLSLHADRQFGPGVAPLSGEELRTMWRLAKADIDQPTTWLVVGILAARMGKSEAACAFYKHALGIAPDFAAAHANLGHAEFQLGEYDSAERRYLRALELAPGNGMVHNNLAAIYYGHGSPEKAVPHLRSALVVGFEVDPQFIAAVERETGQKVRQD
jgi:hypothetical protein